MAFKKVDKKNARSSKLDCPGIHLSKSTSTFNLKFCEAIKLTVVGTKVGVNLMHDEESGKFAFEVSTGKNLKKFDTITRYNTSHQCQIYLRGMLKNLGYAMPHTVPCPLTLEDGLWVFEIPEEYRIDKQKEAEKKSAKKEAAKLSKKAKRLGKDARKKSKDKKKIRSKA